MARFLAAAASRGHDASIVDRDEFLTSDLRSVDLILAKSHYKDPLVRHRLNRLCVPLINGLAATELCRSRTHLAGHLAAHGIPTPTFLRGPSDARPMMLPWIAKPDAGGNHRHTIVTKRPGIADPGTFYQRFLPATRVYKVYSIGDRHDLVELAYSSATDLDNATRTYRGRVEGDLGEAANRVAAATGLRVFNTDFIVHHDALLAIDVNPFPGFDAIPSAATHLWMLAESLR